MFGATIVPPVQQIWISVREISNVCLICELGQAFVDSWKNCKWDKSDRTKHDDYGDGKDNINDKITDDDDDDKSDDRWQCVTLGGCSLEWFTEQRMHTISETCFDMMIRMKRNFQQWEPCNMINFLPYITTSEVQ